MAGWFVLIEGDLLARSDLTPADKLVYGYIRYRIGSHEAAWPGLRTIAAKCGLTKTTAGAAVDRLAAAGLLVVERPAGNPSGKTNFYRLPGGVEPCRTDPGVPESGTPGRPDIAPSKNPDVPESGTRTYQKVVRGRTKNWDLLKPIQNQQQNKAAAVAALCEAGVAEDAARALIGEHGTDSVLGAVEAAYAVERAGRLRGSLAGYVVARLRAGDWEDPPELVAVRQQQRENATREAVERVDRTRREADEEAAERERADTIRRLDAFPEGERASVLEAVRRGFIHQVDAVPENWRALPTWVMMARLELDQRVEAAECAL